MSLSPGARVGSYEVLAPIGTGGMGEVYRARDTRLKRDVALKVLSGAWAHHSDRLARFQREAELLATLNHPNIAAIYGVETGGGTDALVLELVEGPTLADRLRGGPLPLATALAIARQIADALDAAHERGIVHRDLKPSNIKVRDDGTVKVLDFGLAKALQGAGDAGGVGGVEHDQAVLSKSPTITTPAMTTGAGIILGTAAYMSPEQARGQAVDKRTDIWAFGCVLYEMLTGRRTFDRPTASDTIAAILERDPDWSALPASTPPGVLHLIQRCLTKERRLRLRDIGDASPLLTDVVEAGASVRGTLSGAAAWRRFVPWIGGAAAATLIMWLAVPRAPVLTTRGPLVRFSVAVPAGDQFPIESGMPVPIAISPSEDRVVFSARHNGVEQLYSRAFGESEATPIPGTEGGLGPFFSPDGQWVGFYAERSLKRVALAGGRPVTICAAANLTGATWSRDGRIVFSAWSSPLMMVSADGGTPEPVIPLDEAAGERAQWTPQFLPDGSALLFSTLGRVETVDLATKMRQVVIEGGSPQLMAPDRLVFGRGNTIFAVPFDAARRAISGAPIPVLDGVSSRGFNIDVAVAPNGTVAWLRDSVSMVAAGTLAFADRDGQWRSITADRRPFTHPRLSPDGSRIVVGVSGDIWMYDTGRGTGSRLLESASRAVWTLDGARMAFQRGGSLYEASGVTRETPTLILERPEPSATLFPLGWSRNGVLAYSDVRGDTNRDVWLLSPDGRTTPFLNTPQDERSATFSPDGEWMVYAIRDEGVPEQVYVQPSSGNGARTIVSVGGGREPVWSPTGREIFYRSLDAMKLMSVEVHTTPTLRLGTPTIVVETPFTPAATGFFADYDVSRDGRQFLMRKVDAAPAPQELEILLNAIGP